MLDVFGEHLASCPNTGRLRRRGTAFERVYRPLWKESTVRESEQRFVTELIRGADPSDLRQSDVLNVRVRARVLANAATRERRLLGFT